MTGDTRDQTAFGLAVGHHQAGRLAEAETGYREILAADPGHAGALHLLGVIGHQTGNAELAVSLIGKAVAIAPDHVEAHNDLGNALKDLGRLDDAVASYRRCIEIAPDYAMAHNNLGSVLADRGKTEDAIACYRKALDLAPDYSVAHYNLGNALRDMDRAEEAAACYRRAIDIVPSFVEAHVNLGEAIKAEGKIDEAIACFRRAFQLNPHYAPASFSLAVALQAQGQLDEAVDMFKRTVENDPGHPVAHFWLSAALNSVGRETKARRVLEQRIRRQPVRTAKCTGKGKARATILKLMGLCSAQVLLDDGTPWIQGGNLDTTELLDEQKFTVHEFYVHEDNLLSAATELPPFDVVLNGIVEPDLEAASLDTAQAFITRQGALYVNEPRRIFSTSRDKISALLTGIDNLVVPKVAKETLAANDALHFMPIVEKHGLRFPLIVRPVGSHIGAGLTKVDNEKEFARVALSPVNATYYVTEFHDARSGGGYFHKNRIYLIDGHVFPEHMLISDNWNVHSSNSREFMKNQGWAKEKEIEFLEYYSSHLDADDRRCFEEIHKRVGLNFFGLDFAVLSDGRRLLFECNAAMAYRRDATSPVDFPYKAKYGQSPVAAFGEMLLSRTGR